MKASLAHEANGKLLDIGADTPKGEEGGGELILSQLSPEER